MRIECEDEKGRRYETDMYLKRPMAPPSMSNSDHQMFQKVWGPICNGARAWSIITMIGLFV